jgi:hypothetical protein
MPLELAKVNNTLPEHRCFSTPLLWKCLSRLRGTGHSHNTGVFNTFKLEMLELAKVNNTLLEHRCFQHLYFGDA